MGDPEEDSERIVLCQKKNRPCSKPKGHIGKCDSKRKLESEHQFWHKSPRTQADKTLQQSAGADDLDHTQCDAGTKEATVSERSEVPVLSGGGWCPPLPSQVPIGEYRPCVQEKRQGEVKDLFRKKQELEAEVCRLQQEAAAWHMEVQRFRQEVDSWQATQVDLVRRLEQVSKEEEKLRQEKERLGTWEKELEAWDEKVRKILDQKGHSKTKLDQNPTTLEMMSGQTDTWYRWRRLSRECLERVNGGSDGAVVAAFGVMVALAPFRQIDELMTCFKKGKFWQLKFNSMTQKYEASEDNIERSLAAKFKGELSRRKYQFHCKTLSSVYDPTKKMYLPRNTYINGISYRQTRLVSNSKLQAAIDNMDIGHIHPVPGHVGATRPVVSLVHMIVDQHFRLPHLQSELRWFKGRQNHFIFSFADDGTPETRHSSMSVGTLSCWNFGSKVRSRSYQYLLHIVNGSEKAPVLQDLWKEHTYQMGLLEAKSYTIAGRPCTFEFRAGGDESWAATALGETTGAATYRSPWANVSNTSMFIVGGKIGQTWMPWTMEQREADLLKLEEYMNSLPSCLSESTRRDRRNAFMAENKMRQLCTPRIGKYSSTFCPDPLHTETNAWHQLFDVMYHEAVNRDCVKQFTDVLAAPISLPNVQVRNEPAKGKYEGKYPVTLSYEAAGDRVRSNDDITVQSDNLYSKMLSSESKAKENRGEYPSLVGLSMKYIADKVLEHDANKSTRHKKLNSIRFIGENAIRLARYSHRLVDALAIPNEDKVSKVKRHVLGKLAQLLRDAGTLFNQHETNEADLNDLEHCLDLYYNLFCLFLPESGNLTVWTVSKAVPYFARKLYDEYGVGYGIVTMQGKEAKNAKVKDYLKLTNHSKAEGESNKFFQAFRSEYIVDFYLQEHSPSPSQYRPHYNARVPSQVGTPGFCDCGREIVGSDDDLADEQEDDVQVSLCSFCIEALEVVACGKEGELSPKMTDIMFPDVCDVCGQRFSNGEKLAIHKKKTHVTTGRAAEQVRPFDIDIQVMKKDRLISELAKLGKSTLGAVGTLRTRLQKACK